MCVHHVSCMVCSRRKPSLIMLGYNYSCFTDVGRPDWGPMVFFFLTISIKQFFNDMLVQHSTLFLFTKLIFCELGIFYLLGRCWLYKLILIGSSKKKKTRSKTKKKEKKAAFGNRWGIHELRIPDHWGFM